MKRARDKKRAAKKEEKRLKKESAAAAKGSPLSPHIFEASTVETLKQRYAAAAPFPHVVIDGLCDDARARAVVQEAATCLRADFKETDLFKVYQTPDLANLGLARKKRAETAAAAGDDDGDDADETTDEGGAPEQLGPTAEAAAGWDAPHLEALRDAIYSKEFRGLVSELSGCGDLSDMVDCSCNAYVEGGHLLCHDDVIKTRRVSYIIYLTDPDDPWTPQDGGALELYPLAEGAGVGHPATTPCKNILPLFNSMLMFTVVPGVSFHAVQEVFTAGKPRLSISGWFHGKAPPPGMEHATRAQLSGAHAEATFPPHLAPWTDPCPGDPVLLAAAAAAAAEDGDDEEEDGGGDMEGEECALSEGDVSALRGWLNPVYLEPGTIATLRKRFSHPEDGSSIQLDDFLRPELAARLSAHTQALDRRDGLGTQHEGPVSEATTGAAAAHAKTTTPAPPRAEGASGGVSSAAAAAAALSVASSPVPYAAGLGVCGWEACGPVHKQRFLAFRPDTGTKQSSRGDRDPVEGGGGGGGCPLGGLGASEADGLGAVGSDEDGKRGCLLEAARVGLIASAPFRRWLHAVTALVPSKGRSLCRRFRPGLDYTVAHAGGLAAPGGQAATRLDATLCFLNDGEDRGQTAATAVSSEKKERSELWHLWDSGEVGGFECYVEAEDDTGGGEEGAEGADDDTGAPEVYQQAPKKRLHASAHGEGADQTGAAAPNGGGGGEEEEEEEDESDDGDDGGGPLLSVQGRCNSLSLVLRDEGVLRFVKYVSAKAPGSRWDVSAEFTLAE